MQVSTFVSHLGICAYVFLGHLVFLDIREYAVLAIRNILEENDANQALIAELQPMQAVQTAELNEMGLETRLEDGKVKIVKKMEP